MAVTLSETFGLGPLLASCVACFIFLLGGLAVLWIVRSAPPRTIVIATGPLGSSFERFADAYQKLLAPHGVTLEILPTSGSLDNLQQLQSAASRADIGFVQGGLTTKETKLGGLVSLGSVAYQPLWIFYRHPTAITRLSELMNKRIAVGTAGSGTHVLALALLAGNGITAERATYVELEAEAAASDLLAGNIDAVFLMGDSAPQQTLRNLIRVPGIRLFSFTQADGYVRRFPYLNRISLPEGTIDLGKNLPGQDIILVGPTVELIVRKKLNPALTDLLIEVAQEVHGKAGVMQKRGEFPAPLEHEFTLSEDALRYYKSGKGFFYRTIRSFWLASLLNRILVAIVPLLLLVLPAIRLLPVVYRWSIQLKIYRCYRPLLKIERDAAGPLDRERIASLLHRLDEIEAVVDQLRVPASFADQFYVLRGHLAFVRQRLKTATPA